jgi:hypothetical protein
MKKNIYIISKEFFIPTLLCYVLLTFIETMYPGLISNYFNLNHLLLLLILCGLLMTTFE